MPLNSGKIGVIGGAGEPARRIPKVLCVYAYSRAAGGSFTSILDILRYRNREAFEVTALLPADGHVAAEFEALGVRVHFLRPAPAGKNLRYLRAVWAFRRLLRRERIDLVYFADYASWRPPGLVGAYLARVPIVLHVRHEMSDGLASDPWLQTARHIIGNSRATLTAVRGRVPDEKLRVIYNFVDFARLGPADSAPGPFFAAGVPVVGFVGDFRPEKGVEYFLEMAKLVNAQRPDVRFLAVGGDSLITNHGWFDKMHRYALEIGVADIVHFTGPRADVPDIMRALDLLVVPSLTEGLPRVILEASAVGLPVIATNVGGVPEVIEDERMGVLVPPRDPAALSAAVQRALADPAWQKQVAITASQRVRERFVPHEQVAAIEAVWREALQP